MAKKRPFETEVDLCTAFMEAIDKRSWTPYVETEGWDILLVRRADGFQIGVQAKLKFNVHVINQALESGYRFAIAGPGPDCRAVLVPECEAGDLHGICAHLGVTVIQMRSSQDGHWREVDFRFNSRFTPVLPEPGKGDWWEAWKELAPARRYRLPSYVPDGVAGAPSPIQLTEWKIRAIKLLILLDERGFVTRLDFDHLKLDPRRWLTLCWLQAKDGKMIAGTVPAFLAQHPKVSLQIRAETDWRPVTPQTQERMAV